MAPPSASARRATASKPRPVSDPPASPSLSFPGCFSAFPAPLPSFRFAFQLPPTGCFSLHHPGFPILPAAFLSSQVFFHAPACFSASLATFPSFCPLFHLHPTQLLFHPPFPVVCFSAFPAALPFPSTTISSFFSLLATFPSFCLIPLAHTDIHTAQLLFHPSSYFPIPSPPYSLHRQLFQASSCFSIFSGCFSTTTTSSGCSAIPLLLFHLSSYFSIFPAALPPPHQLLFHLCRYSSTPLAVLLCPLPLFPSFFPSMSWSNLLLHHLKAFLPCPPLPPLQTSPLGCTIPDGKLFFPHLPGAPT